MDARLYVLRWTFTETTTRHVVVDSERLQELTGLPLDAIEGAATGSVILDMPHDLDERLAEIEDDGAWGVIEDEYENDRQVNSLTIHEIRPTVS